MPLILYPALFSLFILTGAMVMMVLGRLAANRVPDDARDESRAGFTAVEGAIYGLLALLIAFTFSGASSRFDERRLLVVEEANHIGTAWLRLSLLQDEASIGLQEQMRDYLDARIATYRYFPDVDAAAAEYQRSVKLQQGIWESAVAACPKSEIPTACPILMPALNEMFDVATTRRMATQIHPPLIVFILLGTLTMAGALLAGYGMEGTRRSIRLHMLGFAGFMAITVYIVVDMEFPRLGLISVDETDQVLVELRSSWGEGRQKQGDS